MRTNPFKILMGGRDEKNLAGLGSATFQSAQATNTRLMGVVGVQVCWELPSGDLFHQFFHLDSESYGIDGYESLMNPDPYETETITQHMMGGLGGVFKPISYQELIYLLKWFYALNVAFKEPLPEGREEFEQLLDLPGELGAEAVARLMDRLCVPLVSEVHAIHYYLMRLFGGDEMAADYLTEPGNRQGAAMSVPEGMLLRNEVQCGNRFRKGRLCRAEALVDIRGGYVLVHADLEVVKTGGVYRIRSADKTEEMRISNIEASFLLKKPEFLLVYEIETLEEFIMTLKIENPSMMSTMHEGGVLFTLFNPDNTHVEDPIYYLNGDIHSVYYVTRSRQLVVASFEEAKLREAFKVLRSDPYKDMLTFEEEIILEDPVFYEFVNSGLEDLYDFFDSNGIG